MFGRNRRHSGFLLSEIIIALTILGMLLACLAFSLHGFAKFNSYQLVRQRCIAAAQAELDCIASTGRQIPDEDFSRLWPKLSVSVRKAAGTGQWEGMDLVEVTASGRNFRKEVKIRLSRYVPKDEPSEKRNN